jgi:hypothetical protein
LTKEPSLVGLRVTVINAHAKYSCHNSGDPPKCPAFYNMMTHVAAGHYPHTVDVTFPAGPCERANKDSPCVGPTKEFLVYAGEGFGIEAKAGSPAVCDTNSETHYCKLILQTPHIVASPAPLVGNCGDVVAHSCEAIMPNISAGQMKIDVTYPWTCMATGKLCICGA